MFRVFFRVLGFFRVFGVSRVFEGFFGFPGFRDFGVFFGCLGPSGVSQGFMGLAKALWGFGGLGFTGRCRGGLAQLVAWLPWVWSSNPKP